MSLLDLFRKKDAYKCARCKKEICEDDCEWIGNHRFCKTCAAPTTKQRKVFEGTKMSTINKKGIPVKHECDPGIDKWRKYVCSRCKRKSPGKTTRLLEDRPFCSECTAGTPNKLPEYLLLRTPNLPKDFVHKLKITTCPYCQKESTGSSFLYEWVGNRRYCFDCARKFLPKQPITITKNVGDTTVTEETPLFFYPVLDAEADKKYFEEALSSANYRRNRDQHILPDYFEHVDKITLWRVTDRLDTDEFDSVEIKVYANNERSLWCFRLENSYVSGWDGDLVWNGGFVTPERFGEFMRRIRNTHYDDLLSKFLKN